MTEKKEINRVSIARSLLLTLIAGSFALGVLIGAGMGLFTPLPTGKSEGVSDGREGTFRFIREAMDTKEAQDRSAGKELKPFQYKVNALIEETLKQGEAAAVSLYFRDLNSGNWFGINEHDKLSSGSLLKIPLMIAYFKWAETNPLVLRKTLTTTTANEGGGEEHDRPTKQLAPGQTHSVNDLNLPDDSAR